MQIAFLILLFILGSCFGSFLCCQARRLMLKTTKKGTKSPGSRSICLNCKHQLKWYDNIPILSWLFLRGKCRKCKKPIGYAEILSELGVATAFLMLGTTIDIAAASPLAWAIFIVTLIFTTILSFLAIYDGISGELPTVFLAIAITVAIIILILKEWLALSAQPFSPDLVWQPLLSILIFGGLYLVLYLVSKGKWVGDGDWLLGTAIALVLFDPLLTLVALFVANFSACLIMAPFALKRKKSKIYFGPFMVVGFILAFALSPLLQSLIKF